MHLRTHHEGEVVQRELWRRARLEQRDVEYPDSLSDRYQEHWVMRERTVDMCTLDGCGQMVGGQNLERLYVFESAVIQVWLERVRLPLLRQSCNGSV